MDTYKPYRSSETAERAEQAVLKAHEHSNTTFLDYVNQNLSNTADVTFASLTVTNDISINGTSVLSHINDNALHQSELSDVDVIAAINNDGDHGSTAQHNYFSGAWADIENKPLTFSPAAHTHTVSEITDFVSGQDIQHSDLGGVGADDHHARYTDTEAVQALNADADHGSTAPHNYFSGAWLDLTGRPSEFTPVSHTHTEEEISNLKSYALSSHNHDHNALTNIGANDHHTRYTDSEALAAVNGDLSHGTSASHNYFSGAWSDITDKPLTYTPSTHAHTISDLTDLPSYALASHTHSHAMLTDINADDHHTRYSDSEAITAVNNDTTHGSNASHNYFSGNWADITGIPSVFTPDSHTHTESEITDLQNYEKLINKNQPSGYAGLDVNGKIPVSYLPDTSKNNTYVILSTDPRPAINEGDKLFEKDTGDSYICDGSTWVPLAKAEWENVNVGWANITGKAVYATRWPAWEEVVNKPTNLSIEGHTHTESDILDLQNYSLTTHGHSHASLSSISTDDHHARYVDSEAIAAINNDTDHGSTAQHDYFSGAWADVTGKPAAYTPTAHTHSESEITDLQNYALSSHNHDGIYEPVHGHPYLSDAHGASAVTSLKITNWDAAYTHSQDAHAYRPDTWVPGWTDVTGKPVEFTPSAHTHSESEITDLKSYALDTHGHSHSELSGVASDDHHTRYVDSEAVNAVGGSLNDAGTALTDLWSASKIADELNEVMLNAGDVNSVNDKVGDVVLTASDVGAAASSHNHDGVYAKTISLSNTSKSTSGASLIGIPCIGSPTWITQEHSNRLFASAGCTGDNYITDAGSATINIAAGSGFIKGLDTDTATLLSFDWPSLSGVFIPTDTTRYIGIEYNEGSPQVVSREYENWNHDTEFALGTVVNINGTLHVFNNPWQVTDAFSHIIERFNADNGSVIRDKEIGGLILGESGDGNRHVTITTGRLWSRFNKYTINAVNTSGTDKFHSFYRDGSGDWLKIDGETIWDNGHYDDGSGTLAALNNNWFTNLWFFTTLENETYMLYGQNQYSNSSSAEADAVPLPIPAVLQHGGILLGRIVIQEGETTATEVQSAFDQIFTAAQAAQHNNLGELQGGTITEYYHMTSTEHTAATRNATNTLNGLMPSGKLDNWDAAYSWGNHADLYRSITWVPSWADVTNKPIEFTPAAHTHTEVEITNLQSYALSTHNHDGVYEPIHTHPYLSNTHAASAVTTVKIGNWDAAYSWGNHADAGYVTSSGNTVIGTDTDIDTTGAEIIDALSLTDGVITAHTKRTLTLADLGYTGATNANYYTHPSSHAISFIIGLQDALDSKEPTHIHPYLSNTHDASAVTSTKIGQWDIAYTHSQAAHAPSNANLYENSDAIAAIGGTLNDAGTSTSALWSASKIQTLIDGAGKVDSVNGYTGAVTLNNTDVGAAASVHAHSVDDLSDYTPGTYTSHMETHSGTAGQSVFNLTTGSYLVGANYLKVYINGTLQPVEAYTETDSTTVTFVDPLPADAYVLFEWLEIENIEASPIDLINADTDHGSTAQHDYFTGAWADVTGKPDIDALIDASVADLVDSAPTTLDTLNELAAALGDDPNFATTVTEDIASIKKFVYKDANYTATVGDRLMYDTSTSILTLTLPATPSTGDTIIVTDVSGTFESANLTVTSTSHNIDGVDEDFICNVDEALVYFIFYNNNWIVR